MSKQNRLFEPLSGFAEGALSDELYLIAHNIGETFIVAGVEPGKDYSYLDIIKLAQPILILHEKKLLKEGKRLECLVPLRDRKTPW